MCRPETSNVAFTAVKLGITDPGKSSAGGLTAGCCSFEA